MQALESIGRQVEVATLNLRERVARLYDALHALHDLTLTTFSMTPHEASKVDAWIAEAGFGIDEHGYFERLDVLARARAGETDLDTQIYYANEKISRDPDARFRMYALRELPRFVRGLTERLDGLAWVYYQDATGFAMTYPMHDPCTVVPPDFDWHSYFTYESVKAEVNPNREIRWTPPNIDYGGKGLMVSVSIPLHRGDELIGVWSFDVPVRSLVHESLLSAVADEQSVMIADSEGYLVAHDTIETVVEPVEGSVYRERLDNLGGGFVDLDVPALIATGGGHLELTDAEGRAVYAVHRPIARLGWLLMVTVPTRGLVDRIERSFLEAFERVKSGDLSHRVDDLSGSLAAISNGYNDMAGALQKSVRALERSRAQLQALFDAAPVGIALVQRSGRIVDANEELGRIVRTETSQLVGTDLRTQTLGELSAEVAPLLAATVSAGAAGPIEGRLRSGDGQETPVRLVTRRFLLDDEECVLIGVEDMTERRRLQAQVIQTQKVQAIGRLAGGVAHDFNNLLTVILGSAALLSERSSASDKELADSITFAGERAAALTGQLLAFSRRQVVQPRRIDLADLVGGLERLLRRLLDGEVTLRVELCDDVPPVLGDQGQIEQVVMNLVLNARDAIGAGGHIDVRLEPCEMPDGSAAACIQVTDDGVGMDEETIAQLFEPFFTTKSAGTGLGLATVNDIVSASDGDISVSSSPGEGTVFRVRLPATDLPSKRAEPSAPAERPGIDGHILVVDDEPLVRSTARRSLEKAGYSVETASGGEAAIELLDRSHDRVALVLTDVIMPGMGGRKLMEHLTARFPGLPVLLMSGYTDDDILRLGIEASELELVRKPFTPDVLVRAVSNALSRSR